MGEARYGRLLAYAALFLALTGLGAAWAITRSDVSLAELGLLRDMPATLIGLLLALAGLLYVTDAIRYRVLGRAVGTSMSWRAGLDAAVANFFFSWITPGSALGAPATTYMLHRHGVPWDAAALIAFGKSLTGIGLLLVAAFAMMVAGIGPGFGAITIGVLVPGTAVIAGCLALLAAGAMAPDRAKSAIDRCASWARRRRLFAGPRAGRWIDRLAAGTNSAVERLATLRAGGRRTLVALLLSHVAYFAVFIAVLTALLVHFGAPVRAAAGSTTVYIAFTYVAPTPGGAGLAEATAGLFFADLVGAADAVVAVLLFRAATFYLHIAFGFVYLGIIGGISEILRGKR